MYEKFEDKFMEIQTDLISLCMKVREGNVDKIFAYASIEKKSTMFNAFFEKDGEVVTINQLNINMKKVMEFLKVGTMDLQKVEKLCNEYEMEVPTEIKMYYDVNTRKYNADYKYDEICSEKTGISSGEVFMNWYNELKEN